jgi:hypothetical protein
MLTGHLAGEPARYGRNEAAAVPDIAGACWSNEVRVQRQTKFWLRRRAHENASPTDDAQRVAQETLQREHEALLRRRRDEKPK